MAAKATVRIANGKSAERLIAGIVRRVSKPKPIFEFVADKVLQPAIVGQLKTRGRRGGTPWPGYTTAERESGYLGYKKALTGSETPQLDWDGPGRRLTPSLTDTNHPEHIRVVTSRSATVGTRVPWAADHDKGGGPGWKGKYKLPRREIAVLNTRVDIAKVVEATQAYAHGGASALRRVKAVK